MKQIYITFIALIFSATLFAQGIAVQGIARSNVNAAIVDTDLEFTFEIVSTANVILYAETQQIRTDGFGVFSHIISSGSATVNTFNSVDFSLQGLRARVFIDFSGKTEVYDQPFQYTPYAHYAKKATDADNAVIAANGVPTGSILPFMGDGGAVPEGWLLCDGRDIPSQYTALRAMFDDNRTPNLRGRFLKGAGTGGKHNALVTSQFDETTLGEYQAQSMQDHRHSDGDLTTSSAGSHSHDVAVIYANTETRTVNIFFVSKLPPFIDYFVIDNALYTNEYTWFNDHHSLYLNLDTNLMNTNYFSNDKTLNDVLSNPSQYPYLSRIYGVNKYNDVLDFLYVDSDEAIFYSRTLDEYIQTYRFN